jgi:hypothetical protein
MRLLVQSTSPGKMDPRHPEVWEALASPKLFMEKLSRHHHSRGPLKLLLVSFLLLPGIVGWACYRNLGEAALAEVGASSSKMTFVLFGFTSAIIVAFFQGLVLMVHFNIFNILVKSCSSAYNRSLSVLVWLYSLVPLLLRQFFLALLLGLGFGDQIAAHNGVIVALDPFVIWHGYLAYRGLTIVLGLSKKRAWTVVFLMAGLGGIILLLSFLRSLLS